MLLKCYLYRGVAYYGEVKPDVLNINGKEVVAGHPFATWTFLRGLEIEGFFDFLFDQEAKEYKPEDKFTSIR